MVRSRSRLHIDDGGGVPKTSLESLLVKISQLRVDHCVKQFFLFGDRLQPGIVDDAIHHALGITGERKLHTLLRRRLWILLSGSCGVKEDKGTAAAVPDTNDSARCVRVGIGRSGPAPTGSLA